MLTPPILARCAGARTGGKEVRMMPIRRFCASWAIGLVASVLAGLRGGLVEASVQHAQPVVVVAAADLQYALRDLAKAFEAASPGTGVQLSFGSSGKFFTQLTQGLSADLYFSADAEFPRRLEQAGLLEPGTRRLYAVGRMVIWVRNDLLAAMGLSPASSADELRPTLLKHPAVQRLAIANPVHAPYGRAALTLLEHYSLVRRRRPVTWEQMQGTLESFWDTSPLRAGKPSFEFVLGENISHAAQLALSGTGVGILALSIVKAEPMETAGRYWLAPLESHLRLEQAYAVLRGHARPEVMAFYEFVASPRARAIFRRYGFLLPDEQSDQEAGNR